MIDFHADRIALGARVVLRDVSLRLTAGELVAICGPNGVGKSTLLRALAGLLPGGAPQPKRIGYLPQGARSAWGLTVREVARLGRIPHGDAAVAPVDAALRMCGVAGLSSRRVDQLSGGQLRRAMLARVFAGEPEILLLDEPTADLDPAAAHEIMALLRRAATEGRAVVAVLHAVDLALRYAHRLVVLQEGRIGADLPSCDALPAAAEAFGLPHGISSAPQLLPPLTPDRDGVATTA